MTPLFIALIAIGGTDVLFALDSSPALPGVTSARRYTGDELVPAALGLDARPGCLRRRDRQRRDMSRDGGRLHRGATLASLTSRSIIGSATGT